MAVCIVKWIMVAFVLQECIYRVRGSEHATIDFGAVGDTKTDSDAVGDTKTDSDAVGDTKAESDVVGNTKTDIDAAGDTNTDSGAAGDTNTDSSAVGDTNTDNGAVGDTNADSGAVGDTNADSGAVGDTKAESDAVGDTNTDSGAVGDTNAASGAVVETNTNIHTGGNTNTNINTAGDPPNNVADDGQTRTDIKNASKMWSDITSNNWMCKMSCDQRTNGNCRRVSMAYMSGMCRQLLSPTRIISDAYGWAYVKTPPMAVGYTYLGADVDSPGHDLLTAGGHFTVQEAARACDDQDDCLGLAYLTEGNGAAGSSDRYFLKYWMSVDLVPPTKSVAPQIVYLYQLDVFNDFMDRYADSKCSTNDDGDILEEKAEVGHRDCVRMCHEMDDCILYSWNMSTRKCLMFEQVCTERQTVTGWYMGLKTF